MEGTHQRQANWYRCRSEANRGSVAADVTGHLRALQIKEELILNELIEFMGRRLFGPERLRLLRDELARSVAEGWREHAEIEAMLAAVPDLRPSLKNAGPEELADLLEAFDVTAV
jgi:hypothetical protein